ncbi:MAG: cystathionine gamma-synthase [Candidatus Dormibacteria bacterium]
MSPERGFATRAIHAGQEPDPSTGSVVPALHLSTTYRQRGVGQHQGFDYSRTANPTRKSLETQLASLEGAAFALAFASGMAAEDAAIRTLITPRQGHVIICGDAYGGTLRLMEQVHQPAGLSFSLADAADPEGLDSVWRKQTEVVWLESPSNPTLGIADIAEVAKMVHARGARLVVDNTFATPYLQNPLSLGADLVVHSTTKYLGGHSDVVGGCLALNDPQTAERLAFLQNAAGAVPGPFDCYLLQRGIKTLALRMEQHCLNASQIAKYLEGHPKVARVFYPGLEQHPGHDLALRQMRGFGGMVSFLHAEGEAAAMAMVARTDLFALAESLGAVESLIEHPARMTHAAAAHSPMAVDPTLVRLSVGLELAGDLIADLEQALSG